MIAWLGFERRVALRFLREGRMQTLLIIAGVAAGVAVVTYISALIAGLQANTRLSVSHGLTLSTGHTHSAAVHEWRQRPGPGAPDNATPAVFAIGP